MTRINIKFMNEETIETLKANVDKYQQKIIDNPNNPDWINQVCDSRTFLPKKFTIDDFELKVPRTKDDIETDIANSITLYEHLKDLPHYVLSDEAFWLWILFEKAYKVAIKLMPLEETKNGFKDHWMFGNGTRRSLFFGVISRCYYRVALTVDESLPAPEKYELSRFAIENPTRFREYSWRAISNHSNVVRAALRAEKRVYEEYGDIEKGDYFAELAKDVSKLGSVKIIDVMEDKDIEDYVYKKYITKLEKDDITPKPMRPSSPSGSIKKDTIKKKKKTFRRGK